MKDYSMYKYFKGEKANLRILALQIVAYIRERRSVERMIIRQRTHLS
jgi:hypothetical protein